MRESAPGARPGVGRVRAAIRTALVGAVLLVMTMLCGGRILLGAFLGERRILCTCERVTRKWARAVLWIAGVRVRSVGMENLPPGQPHVLVSNHQSWFDIFSLVVVLPELPRFVGKEELNRIPVFGRAWLACRQVSINRRDQAEAVEALEKAGRSIREEAASVVMFPEGTRSRDGRLQAFKKGAFVLAIQSGAPVVPVFVAGSGEIMRKGSALIRPGTVEVRFGDPLSTEGLRHEDRDRLRHDAWEAVAGLGGEDGRRVEDEVDRGETDGREADRGRT